MNSYIGIDLGGTFIKGGRLVGDKLVQKESKLVEQQKNAEAIFNDICSLIESVWSDDVGGIGFAVPALINFESGVMYGLSNIQELNGFPIQKRLADRFKVPIRLQNDANCFVLGEYFFGKAKNFNNVVGLITGTGVGAGIIINGQLYNGTNCGAGEVGMIPYLDKNFEKYCSGQFFTENFGINGEDLAQRGNQLAKKAFSLYGKHLGELVNLICYVLDPEVIVLGGSVSKSYQLYEDALIKSMKSYFFNPDIPTKIFPSTMLDVAIWGSCSLFF